MNGCIAEEVSLASSTTRLVSGVPAGTRRDEFPLRDKYLPYFGRVKQTNVCLYKRNK